MKDVKILEELVKSLLGSDKKITITIEPNNGLDGSQIEEARRAGREGDEISF